MGWWGGPTKYFVTRFGCLKNLVAKRSLRSKTLVAQIKISRNVGVVADRAVKFVAYIPGGQVTMWHIRG